MSKWCNVHQRTMKILFSSHHHKQKNNNFNNTFSLKLNLEMKRINVYLIIIICLQVLFNFVKTFFQTKGHKHFLNNRICHLHRFPFISYLVICVTCDMRCKKKFEWQKCAFLVNLKPPSQQCTGLKKKKKKKKINFLLRSLNTC